MNELTIWKNGKILPQSEGHLSIYDSALMFGDMAFEMTRTYNKRTFKLWEHLERLFVSLKILEIDIPYSFDDIYGAYENLTIHNRKCFKKDDEIRGLINVSRGLLPIYSSMGKLEPNIIIANFPLRMIIKGMSKYYKGGVHAIVPSQRCISQEFLDPKIKSRSRQHYQMANLEVARSDKNAWALLLDPNGFVSEGTGSNFFLIKKKKFQLLTPKPINCLRGISRQYVMDLAKKIGMTVIETDITQYDLAEATEAFFTNTPFGIMPISKINNQWLGSVGNKTRKLMKAWMEDVKCHFVDQTLEWDKND